MSSQTEVYCWSFGTKTKVTEGLDSQKGVHRGYFGSKVGDRKTDSVVSKIVHELFLKRMSLHSATSTYRLSLRDDILRFNPKIGGLSDY